MVAVVYNYSILVVSYAILSFILMKPSYGMQVTTILTFAIELCWSCSSFFQRDMLFCIRYTQLQPFVSVFKYFDECHKKTSIFNHI